jgi:hypothetical protein
MVVGVDEGNNGGRTNRRRKWEVGMVKFLEEVELRTANTGIRAKSTLV